MFSFSFFTRSQDRFSATKFRKPSEAPRDFLYDQWQIISEVRRILGWKNPQRTLPHRILLPLGSSGHDNEGNGQDNDKRGRHRCTLSYVLIESFSRSSERIWRFRLFILRAKESSSWSFRNTLQSRALGRRERKETTKTTQTLFWQGRGEERVRPLAKAEKMRR